MIRLFQPVLVAYDPYVPQMPEGVEKLDSLDELFQRSKAIVIHAGLPPETWHTVYSGAPCHAARSRHFD